MKRYNSLLKEQLTNDDIHRTIISFFKSTNQIEDSDIHALAEKLGIAPDALETHIYGILRSFLGEGKSKKFDGEYDEKELAMGKKIEMEHVSDPVLAERIAMDHLSEFGGGKYYTALKQMEDRLKGNTQEEVTDNSITAI